MRTRTAGKNLYSVSSILWFGRFLVYALFLAFSFCGWAVGRQLRRRLLKIALWLVFLLVIFGLEYLWLVGGMY